MSLIIIYIIYIPKIYGILTINIKLIINGYWNCRVIDDLKIDGGDGGRIVSIVQPLDTYMMYNVRIWPNMK